MVGLLFEMIMNKISLHHEEVCERMSEHASKASKVRNEKMSERCEPIDECTMVQNRKKRSKDS